MMTLTRDPRPETRDRVVNFQEHIRAEVNRMADEQMAMQEALLNIPQRYVKVHLDAMELHAKRLSELASRLEPETRDARPQTADRCSRCYVELGAHNRAVGFGLFCKHCEEATR